MVHYDNQTEATEVVVQGWQPLPLLKPTRGDTSASSSERRMANPTEPCGAAMSYFAVSDVLST